MSEKLRASPPTPAPKQGSHSAPPISADEIADLLNAPTVQVVDDPPEKRKRRSQTPITSYARKWLLIALAAFAIPLMALAVLMVTLNNSRTASLLADGRIEAPNRLPAVTSMSGVADETWQRGMLTALEWDTWGYTPAKEGTITVFVRGVDSNTVPIVGLYSADGQRQTTSATLTGYDKEFQHAVRANTPYILLISSIGGAAGSYEVRVAPNSR